MKSLVEYLGCGKYYTRSGKDFGGKYYTRSGKDFGEFIVSTISDITDKIIPFFQKYPLKGVKRFVAPPILIGAKLQN